MTDPDNVHSFLKAQSDRILDIYFELRDKFKYNPCFLENLKSTTLTEFFVSAVFWPTDRHIARDLQQLVWFDPKLDMFYDIFIEEFRNELDISYDIVEGVVAKGESKRKLDYVAWGKFCFNNSVVI
jgi:hypothetical protein